MIRVHIESTSPRPRRSGSTIWGAKQTDAFYSCRRDEGWRNSPHAPNTRSSRSCDARAGRPGPQVAVPADPVSGDRSTKNIPPHPGAGVGRTALTESEPRVASGRYANTAEPIPLNWIPDVLETLLADLVTGTGADLPAQTERTLSCTDARVNK
jgi:hypothetical protein